MVGTPRSHSIHHLSTFVLQTLQHKAHRILALLQVSVATWNLPSKQRVGGSNPSGRAILFNGLQPFCSKPKNECSRFRRWLSLPKTQSARYQRNMLRCAPSCVAPNLELRPGFGANLTGHRGANEHTATFAFSCERLTVLFD